MNCIGSPPALAEDHRLQRLAIAEGHGMVASCPYLAKKCVDGSPLLFLLLWNPPCGSSRIAAGRRFEPRRQGVNCAGFKTLAWRPCSAKQAWLLTFAKRLFNVLAYFTPSTDFMQMDAIRWNKAGNVLCTIRQCFQGIKLPFFLLPSPPQRGLCWECIMLGAVCGRHFLRTHKVLLNSEDFK